VRAALKTMLTAPGIQAKALQAKGVPASAISFIPDEQAAIDAALRMGEPGDLLLIFADALVRSWKQVTKFRPEGAAPNAEPAKAAPAPVVTMTPDEPAFSDFEGVVRDERGVHLQREDAD
jgi:cyanophycin synthetase